MSSTDARIALLRQAMSRRGLSAYIVPSSDPHLSEYLPARWQGRRWLSGFTGSVGTLVVTADFAGLWVDSRYWVQAEAQLAGTGVQLMKIALATTPGHVDWLAANTRAGQRIGVDGQECWAWRPSAPCRPPPPRRAPRWRSAPTCWTTSGKAAPACRTHASTNTSRRRLRQPRRQAGAGARGMRKHGADAHFISTLDDIAWLFNLRGADVDYNPVFVGHALVGLDYATLFVAEGKVDETLRAVLAADGVDVAGYAQAAEALGSLELDQTLLIDPARVTCGVFHAMNPDVPRVEAINPSTLLKSQDRGRTGQCAPGHGTGRRGAVRVLRLVRRRAGQGTHHRADHRRTDHRGPRAPPGYVRPSFATIAGFNANGAMPHYRATAESHAVIEGDGLLLIDSGGQYLGGTTDITRVVAVGAPAPTRRSTSRWCSRA